MGDDVDPGPPGIGQDRIDELSRIEDGRRRVAQQGHPATLLGLPERPAACLPLMLHPLVERIVILNRVAEAELLVPAEDPAITPQNQAQQAASAE